MQAAVYFDLDNTLVHRARSIERYAHKLRDDIPAVARCISVDTLSRNIAVFDNGGYPEEASPYANVKEAVSSELVNLLGDASGITREQFEHHWVDQFPRCAIEMPGACELLSALAASGFFLGVISNGADASRKSTVKTLRCSDLLQQVISSEACGIKKPAAEIFSQAISMAGLEATDCWYLGDHPTNDILGSQGAGMRAIWLRGFHSWPRDIKPARFSVDSLAQVLALIQEQTP